VDVTKHLSPWLTLDVLRTRFNDVYEGTVTAVVEEELRHPKTYQRYIGLVLVFDDGRRYGPAKTALRAIVGGGARNPTRGSGARYRLSVSASSGRARRRAR
jgi:hypothetical protein